MVAALKDFGTEVVLMDIAEGTEEIAKKLSGDEGGSEMKVFVKLKKDLEFLLTELKAQ